ncbi:hypothetical protein BGX24_004123 [Mortierella sp. AD032]|nr:hypothetical protein BGX24_004123 [Mortierella sp. AD032]
MDWFLKAANQGDAGAQCSIGDMYEYGSGVPQDYSKAMDWYLKSANQGNAFALRNIGIFYEFGYGVYQDYSNAMEWYLKAANQGCFFAQYRIGYLYEEGLGVPQDYTTAMTWFLKGAAKAFSGAQDSIGNLYFHGHGVPQDYTQAMDWYIKAADQGDVYAQYSIGLLYYSGLGIPQDYPKALEWFLKAADQGHSEGKKYDDVTQRIKDSVKPDDDAGTAIDSSIRKMTTEKQLNKWRFPDPSLGKDMVHWDDILADFMADVGHVRSGTFVLPFLKGSDFKNLDPPRISAIPSTTLDVVVRNHFGEQELLMRSL